MQRLHRPPAIDLALAGALLALGGISALTGDTALPRALTVALTAGYTLPLAFRRQAPLTTAALTTSCVLLFGAIDPDNSQPTLPLALALAAYTVGSEVSLPRSAVAAAAGLSVFLAALFADDAPAADAIFVCVLYGAPYASGALLRRRTAGHEERERRAVEAERARLARELHDVVSHSISVIALQSQAVRRRLEPQQTREADDLRAVEVTARQAMAEMRRLFGVLRKEGEPMPLAPQPGLDQLPQLLERTRAAGLPVDMRIEGEPAPVPPGIDLAAYRIVQEALTNAVRHAGPARAEVLLRYEGERLELRVADDGRGVNGHGTSSGGHGLVGMRERVALYGGRLELGDGEHGGFRVRATLPLREGGA
jgi:signal transduction histidine kinase